MTLNCSKTRRILNVCNFKIGSSQCLFMYFFFQNFASRTAGHLLVHCTNLFLFSHFCGRETSGSISRNRWASIVYRRGQKLLTRLFLKEAEHALQLALSETRLFVKEAEHVLQLASSEDS